MATENRLIDANALLESIEGTDWYTINYKGDATQGAPCEEVAWYKATDIYSAIENAPTVDAVPVVRCKDCKHSGLYEDGTVFCKLHSERGEHEERHGSYSVWMEPDDFCSYGEKREV